MVDSQESHADCSVQAVYCGFHAKELSHENPLNYEDQLVCSNRPMFLRHSYNDPARPYDSKACRPEGWFCIVCCIKFVVIIIEVNGYISAVSPGNISLTNLYAPRHLEHR
jgi:hypothetical protein